MYSQFPNETERSPLSERFAVVGVVVLLHLSVFAGYLLQPEMPAVMVNEMSISFANVQMQQAEIPLPPLEKLKPKEVEPEPAEEPAVKEVAPPVQQTATPPSPVQLDAEPDYSADHLHNPRPPYPRVASRMGYQGKVMLYVEVLADGSAGAVLLKSSSGYKMLDDAAMQAVKNWRFTPAKRLGQAVTEFVNVPVVFKLKDSEE